MMRDAALEDMRKKQKKKGFLSKFLGTDKISVGVECAKCQRVHNLAIPDGVLGLSDRVPRWRLGRRTSDCAVGRCGARLGHVATILCELWAHRMDLVRSDVSPSRARYRDLRRPAPPPPRATARTTITAPLCNTIIDTNGQIMQTVSMSWLAIE
jgi:hypothetical protein